MQFARLGLPFTVLVVLLVACAQSADADTPLPPAGECDVSRTTCQNTVVTPPFRPDRSEQPPGEPQELGGLHVYARMTPEKTALGDEPMSLAAVVTIENLTSRVVTLDPSGCRLKLFAYDQPERANGTRVVQATFEQPCSLSGAPPLEPGGMAKA